MWTPITSAGVSLPLPIDSCCSLSLVGKAHADVIVLKHPHLTFTKLPSSLPVAVVNPSSQLNAISLMQVPIIWEIGHPSIFSMLVVPGLAPQMPILQVYSQLCPHLPHPCMQPLPLQCLTTCPKSHPSRSLSKPSPPPAPPLDKDPLITPSLPAEPSPQAPNCVDPQALYPLNFCRLSFANKQRQDKWLGLLHHYLVSGCHNSELAYLTKSDQSWVKSTAPRCKIIDDLIMYSDVLMDDPTHLHIFVPSDIELQWHLLRADHDSPISMHHGHDATDNKLVR